MEQHTDGFVSDAYATLLLDCAFAEPEIFLQYLAEFDEEAIGNYRHLLYYAILSQEEANLFSRLLTALSSQANLNMREQRALQLLTEVPDWFSYSISPALSPNVIGNTADSVNGQPPALPNGLITTPPANTLNHTHIYTDTTVAATCVVMGYDYHLCRCGAYYCDNFKGIIAHHYQLSGIGAMRSPTYETPGYHTMECQLCGDRYLVTVPAGKDFDLAAIIAQGEAYAESFGFRVISSDEDVFRNSSTSKSISLGYPEIYTGFHSGQELITERLLKLIDQTVEYYSSSSQNYLIQIEIAVSPYLTLYEYRDFHLTVTLYAT
jgi:hypothetical protein